MRETLASTWIQGQTRCLGLLGSGINHSLSPILHNFSAQILGIDCVYVAFDSQSKQFPQADFFSAFWDMGGLGFNVTVPFKIVAAQYFGELDLASVNTIYRGQKNWLATSTDAAGFLLGLKQIHANLADFKSIILLGNGGSARALCEHFLNICALPIFILRRNSELDHSWPKLNKRIYFSDLNCQKLQEVLNSHPHSLLIQSTSAPLFGDRLDYLLPALVQLQGAFVDLVYGTPSSLYEAALQQGLPAQDGLPMLIGQALLAQQIWWKQAAPYAEVERFLRSNMQAKSIRCS